MYITPEERLCQKLDLIAVTSPEAAEAARVIRENMRYLSMMMAQHFKTCHERDAMKAALGLDLNPVTPELVQELVPLIVRKYRVSDHYCLSPDDVAKIINHVRRVVK